MEFNNNNELDMALLVETIAVSNPQYDIDDCLVMAACIMEGWNDYYDKKSQEVYFDLTVEE